MSFTKSKKLIIILAAVLICIAAGIILLLNVKKNMGDDYKWGNNMLHVNITLTLGEDMNFSIPYAVKTGHLDDTITLETIEGTNTDKIDFSIYEAKDTATSDLNVEKSGYTLEQLVFNVAVLNESGQRYTPNVDKEVPKFETTINQITLLINDEEETINLPEPLCITFMPSSELTTNVWESGSSDAWHTGVKTDVYESLVAMGKTKLTKMWIQDYLQIENLTMEYNDTPVSIEDLENINLDLKEDDRVRINFTENPGDYIDDYIFTTVFYQFEDGSIYRFPVFQAMWPDADTAPALLERLLAEEG